MSTTMTMVPEQRQAATPKCEECVWGDCDFKAGKVALYLHVLRQAELAREPFELVLRHRTRNSRSIDPAVRGTGFDAVKARAIGWALDAVRRTHGARFMHPANAEAVARVLCPERWDEDA